MALAPSMALAPQIWRQSGAKAGAINGSGAKVAPWRQSGAKEGLLHAPATVAQRIAAALWRPNPALWDTRTLDNQVSQVN